jgi:hypothetical protein
VNQKRCTRPSVAYFLVTAMNHISQILDVSVLRATFL